MTYDARTRSDQEQPADFDGTVADVRWVFFDANWNLYPPDTLDCNIEQIRPGVQQYRDHIVAFYMEEMYEALPHPVATCNQLLATAAQRLKQEFPGIPFCYTDCVGEGLRCRFMSMTGIDISADVDILGLEGWYTHQVHQPCHKASDTDLDFALKRFSALMKPNHKLLLIPGSHRKPRGAMVDGVRQSEVLDCMLDAARKDRRVMGILSWLYNIQDNRWEGVGEYGPSSEYRRKYEALGRSFKSKWFCVSRAGPTGPRRGRANGTT